MNFKKVIPKFLKLPYWVILGKIGAELDRAFLKKYFRDTKVILFIFGCQRSGTTALGKLFGLSPFIKEFGEGNRKIFTENEKIISHEKVFQEIKLAGPPYVVIKPIMHNHEMSSLLKMYSPFRLFWLFRDYSSVVRSMLNGHPNVVRAVNEQFQKHLPLLNQEQIKQLSPLIDKVKPKTPDYYLLYWIIENMLFINFYSELEDKEKVSVLSYEELTTNPISIKKIFNVINIPITKGVLGFYKKKKHEMEKILFEQEIQNLANNTYNKLIDICT